MLLSPVRLEYVQALNAPQHNPKLETSRTSHFTPTVSILFTALINFTVIALMIAVL